MDTNELIAERAYALWEAEGYPDGRDQEFWFMAESQLREEGTFEAEHPHNETAAPQPNWPLH